MGKRPLHSHALCPIVSLTWAVTLGRLVFPLEELSGAQRVVFPPLPEPHPVPGVRGILEIMSYCLYELCFVSPAKKGLTCKTLFNGALVWRQVQSTVLQEYFGIQHLKGKCSLLVSDKKSQDPAFMLWVLCTSHLRH